MKKEELRMRLIIAQGELKDEVCDDCGCFDEVALCALTTAFACEELLDKSSKDLLIKFDKSIKDEEYNLYIDGVFLPSEYTLPDFTITRQDGTIGSRGYHYTDRERIMDVLSELIRMCK